MTTDNEKNKSFTAYANSFQAVTKPGLERISALCDLLGNPECTLKFIHVAGTNGKGSVCAYLDSILTSAGYHVGKFTSPNLIRVNERITVDGREIDDGELEAILSNLEGLASIVEQKTGILPTQFEIWCAAAFVYFAEKKCDYVVLEVGLGGEFDATNVIPCNEISIITRLGIDHTAYLGDTIEEIARAKAGIIKRSSGTGAVVTVEQLPSAMKVISDKCAETGQKLIVASPKCGTRYGVRELFSVGGISDILCGIAGYHQTENAALAAMAAIELGISPDDIKRGIFLAKHPARFELLSDNPPIIYDGGHNENGIEALCLSLDRYFPDIPRTVIFAAMADKEIKRSLELLDNGKCQLIFTTVKNNPRADSAEALAARAKSFGKSGKIFEDIGDAYEYAKSLGSLTVICGSLYLYANLMEYLNANYKDN